MSQESQKISPEKLSAIVSKVFSASREYLEQEFAGQNEEVVDRHLRDHAAAVSRCSWLAAQKWNKWDKDGPVLMPDNTRIYYRKGQSEIVLQEFQPHSRILKFQECLDAESSGSSSSKAIKSYVLGLPYVVFIFKFTKGMFEEVKCAFCDRPLKTLDEKPIAPYFSNIDTTLKVCLGSGFDREQLLKDQIAQQIAYTLDHFWNACFSDEWSTHYWNAKRHFASNEPKLASLENWEKATEEDPLFAVQAPWPQFENDCFGDIICKMLASETVDNKIQNEIFDELTNELFEKLKEEFARIFDDIESTLPKKKEEEFAKIVESVLS